MSASAVRVPMPFARRANVIRAALWTALLAAAAGLGRRAPARPTTSRVHLPRL